MAIPKVAPSKRGEAERAAEWYAVKILNCVTTRRSIKSRFNKVDFFGADVMGKRNDGTMVYVQATAGQHRAVTARRRKLEDIPWHKSDTVEIVQLTYTVDPANARRKLWFFRVHVYILEDVSMRLRNAGFEGFRRWITLEKAIPIPKEWFRSYELTQQKDSDKQKL